MTQPARRSARDTAATVIAAALALLAAAVSLALSPFFVMATDACGSDDCDFSRLTLAYVVTWGGIGLAAVVAIVGMVRAARRGTPMWKWPALALLLVVVTFAAGGLLSMSVMPSVTS